MTLLQKIKRRAREEYIRLYAGRIARPYRMAPYPPALYDDLISRVAAQPHVRLQDFAGAVDPGAINYFFRHDLDTADCLRRAPALIDMHLQRQIPLSIYLRADGIDYDFRESERFLAPYAGRIDIGLHTSCYLSDAPVAALENEISLFRDVYGAGPRYVTFHGMGTFRLAQRMDMVRYLEQNLHRHGFAFGDFSQTLRHYHHVIQDCHLMDGQRYLKHDVQTLPPSMRGVCYLVLAHPCYWTH